MRLDGPSVTLFSLLLLFALSGSTFAHVEGCTDPREHDVWYSTVHVGKNSFQLPWMLSISRFHTATENETGQNYDELRFTGEPSANQPFMVFVRAITSYSVEDGFDWRLLRKVGEPIYRQECTYKNNSLVTYVYEDRTKNRSVYETPEVQVVVYGESSLEDLVMLLETRKEVW